MSILRRSAASCQNKTKVGLKAGNATQHDIWRSSQNKTKVGLKVCARMVAIPCHFSEGQNKTKVGLKVFLVSQRTFSASRSE